VTNRHGTYKILEAGSWEDTRALQVSERFSVNGMIHRKTDPHCDMMSFPELIKHVYDTGIGTISSGVTQ